MSKQQLLKICLGKAFWTWGKKVLKVHAVRLNKKDCIKVNVNSFLRLFLSAFSLYVRIYSHSPQYTYNHYLPLQKKKNLINTWCFL